MTASFGIRHVTAEPFKNDAQGWGSITIIQRVLVGSPPVNLSKAFCAELSTIGTRKVKI
jgi:hypothetical protein